MVVVYGDHGHGRPMLAEAHFFRVLCDLIPVMQFV